ncbi:MAG: tyrosine-type recombinase/integrase [Candidatus Aerophobetes bacterium]|nr:tyrosine-type recombinase/integrase [Candidatus Aerophobetes bacterium]
MNTVEPIRDRKKILAIKGNLKADKDPRDYLLFTMGINLALRISDLLKLKVSDVLNGEGKPVSSLYLREQKTKREKKIKLNKAVIEALEFYFKKAQIFNPDQLLFTSHRSSKPLDRIRSWQLIRKWCREVGLKEERYGTHTLRKTWGYQARIAGVSLDLISEKLGHRNSQVTRRYIGISQDEVQKVEDQVCL